MSGNSTGVQFSLGFVINLKKSVLNSEDRISGFSDRLTENDDLIATAEDQIPQAKGHTPLPCSTGVCPRVGKEFCHINEFRCYEAKEVSLVRLPVTAGFFIFLYFRLIISKFIYFQHEARICEQIYSSVIHIGYLNSQVYKEGQHTPV